MRHAFCPSKATTTLSHFLEFRTISPLVVAPDPHYGSSQFTKPAAIESDAQHSYLALCRAMPARLRQLHVDLVFRRVYFHRSSCTSCYTAIVKKVDFHLVSSRQSDSDPPDIPSPSVGDIGRGKMPW